MILDTVIYNFHSWKECSGKIHIKVKMLMSGEIICLSSWNVFSYVENGFVKIGLFHTDSGIDFNLFELLTSLTTLKYLKWIVECLIKVLGTYLILIVNVQTITVLSFCVGVLQSNCWCWLKSPIGSIEILGKCDNRGFHQHQTAAAQQQHGETCHVFVVPICSRSDCLYENQYQSAVRLRVEYF